MASKTPGAKTARSVTDTLSEISCGLTADAIPEPVERACQQTTIDTLGLAVGARREDYVTALLASWPGAGECTVWGHERLADPFTAAMINGTAAHGEDYDNTFEGCPVHTGAVIVPAVLAACEFERVPPGRALIGMAVGIEVMCRLGIVARKAVHSAGFHPTAILGAVGAAMSAGVTLGLRPEHLTNAAGIVGSMASGIIEYLADGSWTKRMHPGWAAQAGLRAALMARAGFVGPRTVIEGTHGIFAAFAPSIEPDFGPLMTNYGERWHAADVAFKPYACGTMTQPYIDCAVALAAAGVAADDIVEITCEVGEGTVHRLWEPIDLKRRPPTPYAAKFSTPYCVAVGFLRGGAGLAAFTEDEIARLDVRELAEKVGYVIDPDNPYPQSFTGHLRAVLKDGRVVEMRQPHMRGGVREPMSPAELERKCRDNIAFAGADPELAERILAIAASLRNGQLAGVVPQLRDAA